MCHVAIVPNELNVAYGHALLALRNKITMLLCLANWHPTLSVEAHKPLNAPFWPLANAVLFHVFSKMEDVCTKMLDSFKK